MSAPAQTCGLINAASGKYLTGEKFGFTLNINGATMKSKQIWQICSKEGSDHVFLRSPHNRYLSANEKGVVTADAEDMSGNAAFTFEPQPSGHIAFKSIHNFYFGGSGDQLSCFTKTVGEQESWIVHLYNHPQFVLKNVQRKRYVTADEKANELRCTEVYPWGRNAVITLEFEKTSGCYLLRACNNKVLSQSGKLTEEVSDDTRFQLEFRCGQVAFRGKSGKYLAGVGTGTLQTKREKVDKDELFVLEDSLPQVQLVSHSGKYVSVARGVEVSASQTDPTDKEIFQITWVDGKVGLRSSSGKFLSSGTSSLQDNGDDATGDCLYELGFLGAKVTLKAANGKYVFTKPNGTLSPSGDSADEPKSQFIMNIVNRPLLVLRSEYGFISTVSNAKDLRLECNRSAYEVMTLAVEEGVYTLKGANGQNISQITESKTFASNGGEPARFHVQIFPNSRVALRLVGGDLLKGVSNGALTQSGTEVEKETQFEY